MSNSDTGRTDRRSAQNGLQALSPGATMLLRTLDTLFECWGTGGGAVSMILPPLLPVESLARLDFYDNFPHQALLVSPLDLDKRESGTAARPAFFRSELLEPAHLALPSAACFAVYLNHEDSQVTDETTITVLSRCFRREKHYDGLRRLLGFHMREIVALGSREFTGAHLERFGNRISSFAAALDLPIRKEAATDPFYNMDSQRALLQKLSPVKYEYLVDDLAIASLNVHRNYFGERCNIRLANTGKPVFTSCVAFGLERWISVLFDRYGHWDTAIAAVEKAGQENLESLW